MPWPVEWKAAAGDAALVVVLVRHGQTAWNRERRFLGTTDLPLDEHGEAQARALGDWLPARFERVYTSPLRRARDTASRLDSSPIPQAAWTELAQGELEGLSRDEAVARFPGWVEDWLKNPVDSAVPGGESLRACRDRAWAALEALAHTHDRGVVAVVTHQMVIASLACTASGHSLLDWRNHSVPNTGCTLLVRECFRWKVGLRGFRPAPVQALDSRQ
jgi:probable phosphoglycerate mutase